MKKNKKSSTYGFTLAEVLIVLLIIGVVASITIPVLMNNVEKEQLTVRLKKQYSVLQQAYQLDMVENGSDMTSVFTSENGQKGAMDKLLAKFHVAKNCGTEAGCWYDDPLTDLANSTSDTQDYWVSRGFAMAMLADGTLWRLNSYEDECTSDGWGDATQEDALKSSVCGDLAIDINGIKGPNKMGRDVFWFYITKKGIYPIGSFNDKQACNTTDGSYGCAAKVLREGAMNY